MTSSSDGRCRICTANDDEALAEYLAAALWNATSSDDFPRWAGASSYWQDKFRIHARAFIQAARS